VLLYQAQIERKSIVKEKEKEEEEHHGSLSSRLEQVEEKPRRG
jgi:hypothetical protein